MIPVTLAEEPPSFDAHVRQRGKNAIDRLVGRSVQDEDGKKGKGRKPKETFAREEDIPAAAFPSLWTEKRKSDNQSTLDDMMVLYDQRCAYLAMRLDRAVGCPTVDHFVAKTKNWRLVYEWKNYRLAAHLVNTQKGELEVVDPFEVQSGWFVLNLDTNEVAVGEAAPPALATRIENTLKILNLRDCVQLRGEYINDYRRREIDLRYLEKRAPFIAAELRRQGELLPGDA